LRACFSPKPDPDGVGNGSHVHFSFVDSEGGNAAHDPAGPGELSAIAQSFVGGVVRHMPALTALVAPSPASYLRLGPQHWSCGYASFGIQNREAAIRACPGVDPDPARRARGINMEFRPPDATASPYLVIGSLVRAGLAGVRANLALPPACEADPADLTQQQREQMGIVPLPATLDEALDAFEADEIASSWMPGQMRESYLSVNRLEAQMAAQSSPRQVAERYAQAY
jgi:glutamine synthetase